MADSKYSKSDSGCNSTSWKYNPSYTPAVDPNYDYKTQIVATLNASEVTKNGELPGYSSGKPSSK
jgi:hypothetical protein